MANSLTAFNPEVWARQMQRVFFKENVAISLANTELRDQLSVGDTVNKPYRSHLVVKTYTKGTDITSQDISGTNETLSVATAKVVPFYVDEIDRIQNKWDMAIKSASDAQRMLNNVLDQVVLGEYSNATSTVTAGDVGGSGTGSISLSLSNVSNIFTAAARKLDDLNAPVNGRFVVVGPRVLETMKLYVGGRETGFGDKVEDNGKISSRFGFDIHYSNNIPFVARWTPANNPSDGDTVTFSGVTFTFKTSLTPTAGEVLIGSTTADSLDNLVGAVAQTLTDGTEYSLVSDANRYKLERNGATLTDGATYVELVAYGDIVVSASDSSNDPWSVQVQHIVAGVKGATDLLVQKSPNVEFRQATLRLGRYVYPWMLYGVKTFTDGADQLVDIRINASTWA